MIFSGIVKTSTVDFPGHISAVLFSPGCNFDCFFCHNRHLIEDKASHLENTQIEQFLRRRAGMLEGIVLTGGEATLQEGLIEFVRFAKQLGYKIKLDTNGSRPDIVEQLLKNSMLDYVALDYKAPWSQYREFCSVEDTEPIRKTLHLLFESGIDWEMRTTVIPQLTLDDLIIMAKEVQPLRRYALQLYRQPAIFKPEQRFRIEAEPYTPGQLQEFAKVIKSYQPNTIVRA